MRWTFSIFSLLIFVACASQPTPTVTPLPTIVEQSAETPQAIPTNTPVPQPPTPKNIWQGRVFYEIFVRSFYDSDGDGIGDFNGITEKLDYLNDGDPNTTDDLGITGIWLMPMMESVSYHGYDVTDYLRVERDYGTKADFQRLMDEAHKRGIIVVVDLVLNHSSSEHPWFKQSRDPNSPFRDWYRWEANNGGQGWHQTDTGSYYGIFWDGMPDLNYTNPVVSKTARSISKYWLEEMQVDGFRLDAIKFLIEDGTQIENTPATVNWFVDYNEYLKSINPDSMIVGEVWSATSEVASYVETNAVDLAFEFDVAEAILGSARGNKTQVHGAVEFALGAYPDQRFATFITNHDQNRAASQLFNDPQRGKVAATILLTSPGVPFVYYGEEIGMQGKKPDELIRTPMQWDDSAETAAFTSGTPWQPLNETYTERNVASMADDPNSILNHYRQLIRLRQQYPALDDGAYLPIKSDDQKVYATLRVADDHAVLVIANVGREAVESVTFDLNQSGLDSAWIASELVGGSPAEITINTSGGFVDYAPFDGLDSLESKLILLQKP